MGAETEANLLTAVATIGPIAVTVHAEEDFGSYTSGVYLIFNLDNLIIDKKSLVYFINEICASRA